MTDEKLFTKKTVICMEKVQNKFYKLSKNKKIAVLWEALSHMQRYNGRSEWECIAIAMKMDHELDIQ